MEKKILAISEEEFDNIILAKKEDSMIGKTFNSFSRLPNSALIATLLALLMAEIRCELFSDKYIIGTKKNRRSEKL